MPLPERVVLTEEEVRQASPAPKTAPAKKSAPATAPAKKAAAPVVAAPAKTPPSSATKKAPATKIAAKKSQPARATNPATTATNRKGRKAVMAKTDWAALAAPNSPTVHSAIDTAADLQKAWIGLDDAARRRLAPQILKDHVHVIEHLPQRMIDEINAAAGTNGAIPAVPGTTPAAPGTAPTVVRVVDTDPRRGIKVSLLSDGSYFYEGPGGTRTLSAVEHSTKSAETKIEIGKRSLFAGFNNGSTQPKP